MPDLSQLHIGVDFDNTIVCYDDLFHRVALEQHLIPADLPRNKSEVRNHLRSIGNEPAWTAMQGLVYGPRILEAEPYPGVRQFFAAGKAAGISISIVSHKTRHPIIGEPHDLHAAAVNWLRENGILDLVGGEHVHFELTKHGKLQRIGALACTHFIDDLPEFLSEPDFPSSVQRILFDPAGSLETPAGATIATSWDALRQHFGL
jgi:hypothetical protein